jgi:xanthine dehydrogenase/oxidase
MCRGTEFNTRWSTAQRNAFKGVYRVGCTKEGRIVGVVMDLFNNAGCSLDLSAAIMDRALLHSDGSYCPRPPGAVKRP